MPPKSSDSLHTPLLALGTSRERPDDQENAALPLFGLPDQLTVFITHLTFSSFFSIYSTLLRSHGASMRPQEITPLPKGGVTHPTPSSPALPHSHDGQPTRSAPCAQQASPHASSLCPKWFSGSTDKFPGSKAFFISASQVPLDVAAWLTCCRTCPEPALRSMFSD